MAAAPPAAAATPALTRAPYLSDVVGSVATVSWGTDSTGSATVAYGPVSAGCTGATATGAATPITVATRAEQQWTAQMTGLTPSTPYCYQITQDGTQLLTSTPHFTSALASGTSAPFSFAVLGDWGEATNGVNTDQQKVLELVAKSGVQLAVGTGDIGYGDASQTDYGDLQNTGGNSEVFRSGFWGVPGGSVPMFSAIGNHGWNGVFLQNWPEPTAVSTSGGRYSLDSAGNPQAWYAFDEGNARFYVLEAATATATNQYTTDDNLHWTSSSPQVSWLKNDLASHPGTLKVAVFHYPLWSDDNSDSDTLLQRDLLPILDQYGVRLAFNGHSHVYERNTPYTGGTVNGLVSYVSGGAGADTEDIAHCSSFDAYAIGWSTSGTACHAPVPTSAAQVHHFLKVTVNGTTVTVAPTDENGNVFDQQTYDFAPSAPTGPAATAGASQVSLSWSAPASNGGSAVTGYTVSRSTDGTTWATVASPTGTSYVDTTATAGTTYDYRVTATNAAGLTGPASSQVSATPYAAPSAPTGVTASPQNAAVALTWTAPTSNGSAITGYTVYRSTTSGSRGSAVGTPTGTSFTDTGLTNGTTYYYTVTATNAAGEGAPSVQVSAVPRAVPGAPTGVATTPGDTTVALTWTAPASNGSAITGYTVYRSTTSGSRGSAVGTPTGTTFTDTGLTNGTTYYYTVTATNGAGEGPGSTQTPAVPRTVPGAPTGLTATPGNGSVALTWTAPASNGGAPVTSYNVYRSTDGSRGSLLATPTGTSFSDSGLTNGSTYYYTVTAINAAGESAPSTQVSAVPRAVPGAPTGVATTPGDTTVALTWTAPSSNGSAITGYTVYRSTTSGSRGSAVGTPTGTTFTDTGLTNGTTYYYTVTATNAAGEGPGSTQTPAVPRTVPGAPTGLTATPGNGSVALTWTAPASNGGAPVTSYNVYRSTDGSQGSLLATPTGTSFGDSGLTNGTTYYYTITAVNAAGEGLPAKTTGTPRTTPAAPTGLTAAPQNAAVLLSWNAPADTGGAAITAYTVYRSTTSGSRGNPVGTPTGTTFTDTGLANGTAYYYTVTATNAAGEGAPSARVSAVPRAVPDAPTGVTASPDNGAVALAWTAPPTNGSAITGYTVYRSTTSGSRGSAVGTPTGTSFTDTGLTNGTTYYYTVTATNGAGEGPGSTQTPAVPRAVPGAPTGLTATPGNGSVALTWTAPASNGGAPVTSYNVYRSTDGSQGSLLASPTGTTYTDTDLTNGTSYRYTIRAVNAAGEGSPAASSTTPYTSPGAPTGVTATAGNAAVTVAWSAAAPNGSAVTSYTVYRSTASGSLGSPAGTTSGTSYTDPGLANGTTYYYTVTAGNAAGEGPGSAQAEATPATVPAAPSTASATATDGRVDLSWAQPTSDGGRAVTAYAVYRSTDGTSWTLLTTTSATSYSDTAVVDGTTYGYAVSARNAVGEGTRSTPVDAMPHGGATVAITSGPGSPTNRASATFSFTTANPNGLSVATTCSIDTAPAAPCSSGQTFSGLGDGTHSLTISASDSAGPGGDATYTWVVDTTRPTITLRPLPAVTLSTTLVRWSAADRTSGVSSYDVRYRRAGRDGRFGSWTYPSSWQRRAAGSVARSESLGWTDCFAVRARDAAGNVSSWTAPRCTTRALDDRSLTRATPGWTRVRDQRFYAGAATRTRTAGAVLSIRVTNVGRVALVVTRCRGCGRVQVSMGGHTVATVSLAARTTARRVVLLLPAISHRSGTLTLRVVGSGRLVEIDGLAAMP